VEEGPLTRLRRAAALAAAALAIGAEAAAPAGAVWLSALDAAVAVAFAGGAAAVAPASGRTADLALAIAVTWGLGTIAAGGDLPAALVLLHRAPLAVLVVTYPGRPLWAAAPVATGIAAVSAAVSPVDARAAATAAVSGIAALAAAVGAARTAPVLRPPRAAAALAGGAIAAVATAGALELADPTAVLVVYDAVVIASAAGLLGLLAAGRWSAAAATGLALELGGGRAGAPVTAGLAAVLRDPDLELRIRLAGGAWTDEAGAPAAPPEAVDGGHAVTRRVLADGTEVALLHDPAAITDPAAAESAVAVAATAVDNARRERVVRDRIAHLQRLRRGLLDAADEERRALEDELQLGPLREADAIAALLPEGPLREELQRVRAELAEIARGLYPAVLARDGLVAALQAAAARSPHPVAVAVAGLESAHLSERVALTVYYVVTEALVNVAKHAGAATARVELTAEAGRLDVRVVDDGRGGADAGGGGLRGLRDRVVAVGGELRVTSPPDGGTVVAATLPLPGDPHPQRS
jgi:hypothetical protein